MTSSPNSNISTRVNRRRPTGHLPRAESPRARCCGPIKSGSATLGADLGLATFERHGFAIRSQQMPQGDVFDSGFVRTACFDAAETLVRDCSGADRVLAFDYAIRIADPAVRDAMKVSAPITAVHADYSERSGMRQADEVLQSVGLAAQDVNRYMIINSWRPLGNVVTNLGLAVGQADTFDPLDLVETRIDVHSGSDDATVWTGHLYSVRHNLTQQWWQVSSMEPNEVMLFKSFDSCRASSTRFTPHAAFSNPHASDRAAPARRSIEIRCLALLGIS